MGRPRVLVSGGSGFLGGYLLQRLARGYEVYAGFRSGAPRGRVSPVRLELTDKASIDAVRRLAPGYVVHNAALTKPDLCEDDPNSAYAMNVDGTRLLAEAVQDSCIRFVYCSTDLVFDGARPESSETDTPSPLMVYGRTKLEGEEAARDVLGERVNVVRLALLYGKGRGRSAGRTFTERTLEEARQGRAVRLFRDVSLTVSQPAVCRRCGRGRGVGSHVAGGTSRRSPGRAGTDLPFRNGRANARGLWIGSVSRRRGADGRRSLPCAAPPRRLVRYSARPFQRLRPAVGAGRPPRDAGCFPSGLSRAEQS